MTARAWTLQGLVGEAGIDAEVRGDADVAGLAYDSLVAGPGDLFCCIPGEMVDGHDFAHAAASAGASALLVERFIDVRLPQARVRQLRAVLGPLAHAFFEHPSQRLTLAGVTGTNGKTTVTYILESIAKCAGKSSGVIGTISRRFAGVVESATRNTPEAIDVQRLLRRFVDADVELAVMEVTSDGLAQDRVRATRFATAGFTNLTQDHLNTHKTMEAYFEAKASLFAAEYTPRAVINVDDPYGRELSSRASALDVMTYGTSPSVKDPDISCTSLELRADGSRFTLRTPSGAIDTSTHLVGAYNVSNCMCAAGMAIHCGLSSDDIARGIASLDRVPGRLERIDAGQPFLALVDYAHTPDALDHALLACRELATGAVIVVFGCGGDRDRTKRPLMGEAATRLADLSLITSDNPRTEDPAAIVADVVAGAQRGGGAFRSVIDRREAIAEAIGAARAGDVVLIAGKGHEEGQQFADRTLAFDDRAVTRELLESAAWTS